jgi:hypothetical protein
MRQLTLDALESTRRANAIVAHEPREPADAGAQRAGPARTPRKLRVRIVHVRGLPTLQVEPFRVVRMREIETDAETRLRSVRIQKRAQIPLLRHLGLRDPIDEPHTSTESMDGPREKRQLGIREREPSVQMLDPRRAMRHLRAHAHAQLARVPREIAYRGIARA